MAASLSVTVGCLARSDHDPWLDLREGYNAFHSRAGATVLPAEVAVRTGSLVLDPYEPTHALAAEAEGHLLGLAYYLSAAVRSASSRASTCRIVSLPGRARTRRRPRGSRQSARRREGCCAPVYWQTHESNVTVMALYHTLAERSGFVVQHRRL